MTEMERSGIEVHFRIPQYERSRPEMTEMERTNIPMKKMRRAKWKVLIGGVVLVLLLLLCLHGMTYVLRDKDNSELVYTFYEEEEDTVDVIFVGSSHAYRSIYPLDIWHEYGITSWNLGSSEQSIAASYYLIKDAVREQSPDVVVMEMYMSFIDTKYYDYARIHQVSDNMPFSRNKLQFIADVIPSGDRLEFYFPIVKYHERWTEITKEDFQKITDDSKGVGYSGGITAFDDFEILDTSDTADCPDITYEYIRKAKELCDENDAELVLLAVPYIATDEYEYRQQMLNSIYDLADELDVTYIDMFHELDEIGIDFQTDFAESQHLNVNGAKKVTSYIGAYLAEECGVKSRRDDEDLANEWDKAYKNSLKAQKKAMGDDYIE